MVTQGLAKPSARNGVQVQVLLAPPILNSAGLRSPALFSFQNRLFCYCVSEAKEALVCHHIVRTAENSYHIHVLSDVVNAITNDLTQVMEYVNEMVAE